MAPEVKISTPNFRRLKAWAEPLEDTVDTALSKVLDAAEQNRNVHAVKRPEATNGSQLQVVSPAVQPAGSMSQKEFRVPLLVALYEMGGKATTNQVRTALLERFSDRFSDGDYKIVGSSQERWWNAASWERKKMVDEGLFKSDSPRGVWELSESGVDLAEREIPEQGVSGDSAC